ncbi:hypothetical protein C922_00434 [Plasmodium inui San Antonio 1]|uniref:Uncharacterized protein n=1 Tax=Plasmodium inui San Antonio 1 TaxID=1237626 RepID=W7ACZ6_9APIC|nr:hypothetical protein C922_00434 [Plasmodium inui San Antonio 1]EUD69570.1 hypothetical protein C922_00434 [Plasmodium inui San Antonio 1]
MQFQQGYPQYQQRYIEAPGYHRGDGFAHQLSSLLKDRRIQKQIYKVRRSKKHHGEMNYLSFNGTIDKIQNSSKGKTGYE